MLALDRSPGSIAEVSSALKVPPQVVSATVARLMQFGVVEVRMSPRPVLTTSRIGHDFIRSNKALPERTEDRELNISIIFEPVGHSLLRNRDVKTVPMTRVRPEDHIVEYPRDAEPETEESMLQRVGRFMNGTLRPGEWLRGVKTVSSVLERKYLVIDLEEVRDGVMPIGASPQLVEALQATLRTGVLPVTTVEEPPPSPWVRANFDADHLVVGGDNHVRRFEEIVGAAKADVFVLSTFVATQADEKGGEQRERIFKALEEASRRGVRCHLFFGTSLERSKHAVAMDELKTRLSAVRRTRGYVLVHRDSVGSHAKILAADDGQGSAVVSLGSCNWLSSPFSAVEVSAELQGSDAAPLGLDLLRSIISSVSSASRSAETLQFMASDLRRNRRTLVASSETPDEARTRITVLYAHEHERLLRAAAHEASTRFICCTNKVGSTMVPGLFNPAEVAGRRLDDVRVYYSRQSALVKRRHVAGHRERLLDVVDLIGVRDPQVHAKFLLWDENDIVVSSMNWGSQTGSPDDPLDEVGLYLQGPGVATHLLERFEAEIGSSEGADD
ncbi:hypothetical protein [Devosia insulae]